MFLSVMLLVIALPLSASATSRTVDQAIAWANSKVGQAIDYDGAYGAQCVDLILAYYNYLGVPTSSGNGKDYAWNTLPANWTRVQGGTPQRGDILVYSGSSDNGGYGHVAIYESDYVHYDQNIVGYYGVVRCTWHYNYNGNYWGYIRPNWSSLAPIPADKITLDNPWLDYRSENNAVVHSVIRNNGAAVGCDKYNFQIWEKYSGKLLKTYSEDISHLKNYDHNDVWLDIATETGLYLSPNTAYQCQFSGEKGGKTYSSSKFEFITKYSSSEDSKKPANVKLTVSSTECKVGDTVTLNFSVTDGVGAKGARYFQLLQNGSILRDKLTATSASVTLSEEGEYSFTLRAVNDMGTTESAAVKVIVTEKDGEQESTPGTYPGTPFTDISTHWGRENIKWAYENKLFSGVSETKFAPEQKMNRGMLATVLWRLAGQPGSNGGTHFADVAANAYYAKAVAWAAQSSVVSGIGKGKYDPNGNITREQLVTMLFRYVKPSYSLNEATLSSFADGGKVSKFAKEAMCWAIENRILSGKGNGKLDPQGSATRAEVAAILNRYAG